MKKINILVPDLPESVNDATVVTWYKEIGDTVYSEENIVDIETDKVMLEVSSPCDGILATIFEKEGRIVKSQDILGQLMKMDAIKNNSFHNIQSKEQDALHKDKLSQVKEEEFKDSLKKNIKYFTPSIRRLIKKNQDKNSVLLKRIDYQENFQTVENSNQNTSNIYKKCNSLKEINKNEEKRVKMTRLRQKISERLLESQKNTAMLTTFNEVNMQPIIELRKKYGASFEKEHGIRLGFMSFYVKAVVEALKKFPVISAYIDNTDIVYCKNFDISIAISTQRGLITPVLRNVENMTMPKIEKKIKEFSEKGRKNTISIQELKGGHFTITNGGVFGSLMSTPIINPPQSAILGMHLIQDRPVVIDKTIKILPMMYLALSYDHRLIDGKESVNFLVTVKNILEDFNRILINI